MAAEDGREPITEEEALAAQQALQVLERAFYKFIRAPKGKVVQAAEDFQDAILEAEAIMDPPEEHKCAHCEDPIEDLESAVEDEDGDLYHPTCAAISGVNDEKQEEGGDAGEGEAAGA